MKSLFEKGSIIAQRYKILAEIGRGGMGVVYKAEDLNLKRIIAIKSIRMDKMANPEEVNELKKRLFREAHSAAILNHPNIITLYDMGEYEDIPFICMEYFQGITLKDIIVKKYPLTLYQIFFIIKQILNAIDYAHQNGIYHRDIKPSNIMVSLS